MCIVFLETFNNSIVRAKSFMYAYIVTITFAVSSYLLWFDSIAEWIRRLAPAQSIRVQNLPPAN